MVDVKKIREAVIRAIDNAPEDKIDGKSITCTYEREPETESIRVVFFHCNIFDFTVTIYNGGGIFDDIAYFGHNSPSGYVHQKADINEAKAKIRKLFENWRIEYDG